jgi:hypothetical protein
MTYKPAIPRTCLQCGNPFLARPDQVRRGTGLYCNRLCARLGKTEPIETRFWRYVQKSADCWLWVGSTMKGGYGKIGTATKTLKAHHVSYALHTAAVPAGLAVLHRCDTPACVRPDHLFLGTIADNNRDMVAKGRHWSQTGSYVPPSGHGRTVRLDCQECGAEIRTFPSRVGRKKFCSPHCRNVSAARMPKPRSPSKPGTTNRGKKLATPQRANVAVAHA